MPIGSYTPPNVDNIPLFFNGVNLRLILNMNSSEPMFQATSNNFSNTFLLDETS